MTEREKVINGLMCIAGDVVFCAHCKYSDVNGSGRGDRCKRDCAKDALELLKAQEPVKPVMHYVPDGKRSSAAWQCGNCLIDIGYGANYCYNCGRAVKWE